LKPKTQHLVQLLSDDVPGRIVDALRVESQTAAQLVKLTSSSATTVSDALDLLFAHGIIEWTPPKPDAKGRPARMWRLAAPDDLAQFERACDDFKARMLRHQLAEYPSE
jgi:predicted ArsR family transcriptional regulator